ncbi:MAG TPA: hypothetical protein VLB04_02755 [Methanotrichaceae archaeon]|nr:hypothetical protein [Methanotrichaceae archaeon]
MKGCREEEGMRGNIKLFTLQIDVERAHRCSAARAATIGSLDQSAMLSMDLRVRAPQGLISGR